MVISPFLFYSLKAHYLCLIHFLKQLFAQLREKTFSLLLFLFGIQVQHTFTTSELEKFLPSSTIKSLIFHLIYIRGVAITVIWSLPLYPTKTKAKVLSRCLCDSLVTTPQNNGVLLLVLSKFSSRSKRTPLFPLAGLFSTAIFKGELRSWCPHRL